MLTALALMPLPSVFAEIPVVNGDRILFIGNSFTGLAGGLHNYVRQALADGTPSITVTTQEHISWAQDLDYIYNSTDAVSVIRNGNWDIVVVQGYWSGIDYPAGSQATFLEYCGKFKTEITGAGGRMVLFMPWVGNPTASWMNDPKYVADTEKMIESYRLAGQQTGAPVAPCGEVWYDLTQNPPKTGLPTDYLYGDDIHGNNLSSYLNSDVFYGVLTGRSPVGLDFQYTDVTNVTFDAALRAAFQEKAWEYVQKWSTATRARERTAPVPAEGFNLPRRGIEPGTLHGRIVRRCDPRLCAQWLVTEGIPAAAGLRPAPVSVVRRPD